jgi:uncharacterized protein (DUF433 family)
MSIPQSTISVPLATDDHGVVRVGGTRVTLQTIVGAFHSGSTPEEIAQQYPVVALCDVYSVISYYLQNRAEVEQYIAERNEAADEVRKLWESQGDLSDIRKRLASRIKSGG